MARPGADAPAAEAIRALIGEEGRLGVRVTPGARTEGLAIVDGHLHARVRAKPQDGEANRAVLKLLAKSLGLPTSRLRLLRGATARDKLVQVEG